MTANVDGFYWWSLSARRAWIEMPRAGTDCARRSDVALRKESVDRN